MGDATWTGNVGISEKDWLAGKRTIEKETEGEKEKQPRKRRKGGN